MNMKRKFKIGLALVLLISLVSLTSLFMFSGDKELQDYSHLVEGGDELFERFRSNEGTTNVTEQTTESEEIILPEEYTIEGNKVYIDNDKAYLSAEPHTLKGSGWVEFEVKSKNFTGDVNLLWGFDTSKVQPTRAEYYNPQNVTDNYTTSHTLYDVTSFETSESSCDIGEGSNTYLVNHYNGTDIVCFDSYNQNGSDYTIHWTEEYTYTKDWHNINNNIFNSFNKDFNEKNEWYYLTNVPFEAGVGRKIRAWVDVKDSGKYDLIAYPSSYGTDVVSAYNDGNLFILDPWVNYSSGNWNGVHANTEEVDGKIQLGSEDEIEDAHGWSSWTTGTATVKVGMVIETNKAVVLNSFTKKDTVTATKGYVMNKSNYEMASASFSGDVVTFDPPVNLESGKEYWLVVDKDGASYTRAVKSSGTPSYPYSGTNIDWTNAIFDGGYEPTHVYNVVSANTSAKYSTGNFTANPFSSNDSANWNEIYWGYVDTDISKMEARGSEDNSSWNSWAEVNNTEDMGIDYKTYFQWRASFDDTSTKLSSVNISYEISNQPPTVTDIQCQNSSGWFTEFDWDDTILQCRANCSDEDGDSLITTLTLTNGTTTQVDNLTNTSYTGGLQYWNFTNVDVLSGGVWNVSVSAYDGEFTAQNSTSWNVVSPIPLITFNSQSPAQVTTFNIFSQNKVLNYTITSLEGINPNKVKAYYKTNTTTSDIFYYVNGTKFEGFQTGDERVTNYTDDYLFNLSDNEVYPTTYNFNEGLMKNYPKQVYNLNKGSDYLKVQLLNVSNTSDHNILEFYVDNVTDDTNSLRVYYCNNSYVSDNVITSDNCGLVSTILATETFNHTHGANSKHYVTSFPINTTSGETSNNVKVTSTSYFILRGVVQGSWNAYYITNVSRVDAVQYSTNNGNSWTNLAGTMDLHLHQYDGTNQFHYYVCANSTTDYETCSDVRSENITYVPLPPSAPNVYNPNEGYYFNNITINYTASISPQTSPVWYNITLTDINQDYVQTIVTNNTNNLGYVWNSLGTSYADYFVQVEACDNQSLCNIGYSENFTIYNHAVVNVSITSSSSLNYSNGSLNLNFDYFSDLGILYEDYEVKWWVNGAENSTFVNQTFIDEGNLTKGLTLNASIRLNDGNSWTFYNTSTIYVENFAPTTPYIVQPYNNSLFIYYDVTLQCTNSTDIDPGDTVYYEFWGNYSDISDEVLLQNATTEYYNFSVYQNGTFYWRCRANDEEDTSEYSDTYQFRTDTAVLYYVNRSNKDVIQGGTTGDYYLNVTFNNASVDNIVPTFWWNGESYSYDTTNYSANKTLFYSTFQLPLLEVGTQVQANWTLEITRSNGTILYDYYNFTQNITGLTMYNCKGLAINDTTIRVLNISIKDEQNLSLIPLDFEGNFKIWFEGESIANNNTYEFNIENTPGFEICISPNNTYRTYAQFKYSSEDYVNRDYYLTNTTLDETTQNLTLYSLLKSESMGITLNVVNENDIDQESVYVLMQRYNVDTDSYENIGMAKTDGDGEDYIYLEPYDVWYNFIVKEDVNIILTTKPQKISSTNLILRTAETIYSELVNTIDDISYTFIYDDVTRAFLLSYATDSGTISKGCLEVIRRESTGDTYVCDTCSESASATITCFIGAINETYIANFYIESSPSQIISTIIEHLKQVSDFTTSLGTFGIFLTILIVIGLTFAGSLFGAWGVITFGTLGVVLMAILGILNIGYGAILAIGLIAAIIISQLRA